MIQRNSMISSDTSIFNCLVYKEAQCAFILIFILLKPLSWPVSLNVWMSMMHQQTKPDQTILWPPSQSLLPFNINDIFKIININNSQLIRSCHIVLFWIGNLKMVLFNSHNVLSFECVLVFLLVFIQTFGPQGGFSII